MFYKGTPDCSPELATMQGFKFPFHIFLNFQLLLLKALIEQRDIRSVLILLWPVKFG